MSDSELVFATEAGGRPAIVCNFGVYAGREATPAEVDRLGERLLEEVDAVDVVCERRATFGHERHAELYQVRVEPRSGADASRLVGVVESWADDCIAERRLITP